MRTSAPTSKTSSPGTSASHETRAGPPTKQTAWLVGQIEGQEAAKGNTLPFNDLLIAAAAIEQGYAVLTGNLRHFQKIPSLKVVAW